MEGEAWTVGHATVPIGPNQSENLELGPLLDERPGTCSDEPRVAQVLVEYVA